MARLLAAAVVAADVALFAAIYRGDLPWWALTVYAAAAASAAVWQRRCPVGTFGAALGLAAFSGSGFVLLIWASYQAGRDVVSRTGVAVLTGVGVGGAAMWLALLSADVRSVPGLVTTYIVFVALPLLVGRYLAQQQRLVAALDRHNRQLRRQHELLAEQERLRERLRIARDMHDSLGRRLSLVSVQAGALEVSPLPEPHRSGVRQLAAAAREAVDALHAQVTHLRTPDGASECGPKTAEIDALAAQFRVAGMQVELQHSGTPQALSARADHTAYRVVEEGLTNAAKHAPGQPATVSLTWETDTLLVAVDNPIAATAGDAVPGHGLTGLQERTESAGGMLRHGTAEGEFRLAAMLPAGRGEASQAMLDDGAADPVLSQRARPLALAVAAGVLMFAVVPAGMLLGVG